MKPTDGRKPGPPPEVPEVSRPLRLDRLRPDRPHPFAEAADAPERQALARLIGARKVEEFTFSGRILPLPAGGWRLEGQVRAALVRSCVVTLKPVEERLDLELRRSFVAEGTDEALDIDPEEDDEIEPYADRIDLGHLAIEALVLSLDPYPRAEGAVLPGAVEDETAEEKPFAALAALKARLGGEDGG